MKKRSWRWGWGVEGRIPPEKSGSNCEGVVMGTGWAALGSGERGAAGVSGISVGNIVVVGAGWADGGGGAGVVTADGL